MSEYYREKAEWAVQQVKTLLSLPDAEDPLDLGGDGAFDPWALFPWMYGSYSSDFDDMALDVLRNMRDRVFKHETLAHEMFREMLCKMGLCDYGTSPRGCFPVEEFKDVLPELIARWEGYAKVRWS